MHNAVDSKAPAVAGNVDRTKIREVFDRNHSRMTIMIARELGVPELEVIRAMPENLAWELDASRWEELIRSFEPLGNLHVIASNAGCTLECFGQFGNFSSAMGHFNVQTKSIDMHIRPSELSAVFAVIKPGHMDGIAAISFQFYDRAAASAFKVFLSFGGNAPSTERMKQFTELRDRFLKAN